MDRASIITAYRRQARTYDRMFGQISHRGRRSTVELMGCKPGETILEVGVGTGLSLPLYPKGVNIHGIDISPHMLDVAHLRVAESKLENVELHNMDSMDLKFPDGKFDKVVAMYVATVVPDPKRMVDEMRRVCKPGGSVYIINHFSHANPVVGAFESMLHPFSKLIGFRPVFDRDTFIADTGLDVLNIAAVNLFNYWTLIHASPRIAKVAGAVAPASVLDEPVSQAR